MGSRRHRRGHKKESWKIKSYRPLCGNWWLECRPAKSWSWATSCGCCWKQCRLPKVAEEEVSWHRILQWCEEIQWGAFAKSHWQGAGNHWYTGRWWEPLPGSEQAIQRKEPPDGWEKRPIFRGSKNLWPGWGCSCWKVTLGAEVPRECRGGQSWHLWNVVSLEDQAGVSGVSRHQPGQAPAVVLAVHASHGGGRSEGDPRWSVWPGSPRGWAWAA